jgi:hypothetical protein
MVVLGTTMTDEGARCQSNVTPSVDDGVRERAVTSLFPANRRCGEEEDRNQLAAIPSAHPR